MESTENDIDTKVDEHVITNEQVIADHFNEFFVNAASKLKQPLKPPKFIKMNIFINSKMTGDVSFDIPYLIVYL